MQAVTPPRMWNMAAHLGDTDGDVDAVWEVQFRNIQTAGASVLSYV